MIDCSLRTNAAVAAVVHFNNKMSSKDGSGGS